ncbi:MAG: acylphosphatase [Bacteroidetes bacterium]|nr:acylphosphatase [Bacteroidota bacterium]
MEVRAHILVKGMVQGVGFRYFVASHANQLRLVGYARNLFNGDVEIVVEGERGAIEELIKIVKVGPRMAHIEDVQVQWGNYSGSFRTFEIR